MGKFSRDKGARMERNLVKFLQENGFPEALRVPLSGAAKGFKGDVVAGDVSFELKSRKDEFDSIYDLWERLQSLGHHTYTDGRGNFFRISEQALEDTFEFPYSGTGLKNRTVKKVFGMKKLKGDCDFLVIKGDRKPFLFIKYWSKMSAAAV